MIYSGGLFLQYNLINVKVKEATVMFAADRNSDYW